MPMRRLAVPEAIEPIERLASVPTTPALTRFSQNLPNGAENPKIGRLNPNDERMDRPHNPNL